MTVAIRKIKSNMSISFRPHPRHRTPGTLEARRRPERAHVSRSRGPSVRKCEELLERLAPARLCQHRGEVMAVRRYLDNAAAMPPRGFWLECDDAVISAQIARFAEK